MNGAAKTGYTGVSFYAELTRKGGKDAGTVLIVREDIRNGRCMAAIGVPRGAVAGKDALPVTTWTSPEYLATKCRKVTEEEARKIDPATFKCVDAHHRSPEYRAMYEAEVQKPGRSPLQRANDTSGTWVGHKFYELYGA